MRTKLLPISLALSIALNVVIAAAYFNDAMTGCAERPNGRVGVLTRDLEIGRFDGTDKLFVLPKGLTVREASATGADWFEPHRFRLVVTSDHDDLVRYAVADHAKEGAEYYSADIHEHAPMLRNPK